MSKKPKNTRGKASGGAGGQASDKTLAAPVLVARGALPEMFGPADLPALNLAMRFLFDSLRKAAPLFHRGPHGGRAGAIRAVETVWKFLMLFEPACRDILWSPLLNLDSALSALDYNNVQPLLQPRPRIGRAPASPAHQALIGCVAGTVRHLRDTGLKPADAHSLVAAKLNELGVKPIRHSRPIIEGPRKITDRTVQEWCEKLAADVGRQSLGAWFFDSMFTDATCQMFVAKTATDSRRLALELLCGYVLATRAADAT